MTKTEKAILSYLEEINKPASMNDLFMNVNARVETIVKTVGNLLMTKKLKRKIVNHIVCVQIRK